MSETLQSVSASSFQSDVLEHDIPVLVDVWAPWCAPCRAIGPLLEALAQEYTGKIKIVKMNVDENREKAVELGVRGVPALMIFKNGVRVADHVGAAGKDVLEQFIVNNI